MSDRKRSYREKSRDRSEFSKKAKMNDLYWDEIKAFERDLRKKYEHFKDHPKSHKDEDYHSRRFLRYYKNSGTRWRNYWDDTMDHLMEKELREAKQRIWAKIERNFIDSPKKEVERSISTNNQANHRPDYRDTSSKISSKSSHASDSEIDVVTVEDTSEITKPPNVQKPEVPTKQTSDEVIKVDLSETEVVLEVLEPNLQSVDETVVVEEALNGETHKEGRTEVTIELAEEDPVKSQQVDLKKSSNDCPQEFQFIEALHQDSEPSKDAENNQQVESAVNSTPDQSFADFPEISFQLRNQICQNSSFEVVRDMKYLRAWLRALNPQELDTLLEQEYNENEESGVALEDYLSLVLFQNKSNDYKGEDEGKITEDHVEDREVEEKKEIEDNGNEVIEVDDKEVEVIEENVLENVKEDEDKEFETSTVNSMKKLPISRRKSLDLI